MTIAGGKRSRASAGQVQGKCRAGAVQEQGKSKGGTEQGIKPGSVRYAGLKSRAYNRIVLGASALRMINGIMTVVCYRSVQMDILVHCT